MLIRRNLALHAHQEKSCTNQEKHFTNQEEDLALHANQEKYLVMITQHRCIICIHLMLSYEKSLERTFHTTLIITVVQRNVLHDQEIQHDMDDMNDGIFWRKLMNIG